MPGNTNAHNTNAYNANAYNTNAHNTNAHNTNTNARAHAGQSRGAHAAAGGGAGRGAARQHHRGPGGAAHALGERGSPQPLSARHMPCAACLRSIAVAHRVALLHTCCLG